jgi:two-component system, response regulator, stage 0 sporulation protein F
MAKVLIVEDELPLRMAYDTILKRDGHTVDRAKDGQEALEKAEKMKPDLILLDLLMPNVDGIEFLKKYNLSKHPKVKVVVFSNLSHSEQIQEAEKLGATRYVVKSSVTPSQLTQLLEEVLGASNKK